MPKYLSPEEIGLYRTILGTAALFAPIPLFGLRSAFIRFFPRNNERQNATLVVLGLIVFLSLFFLLAISAYLLKPTLIPFFEEKANEINDYLWLILILIGLMGLYGFFESILKAQKDITTPSFVRETLYKALQSIAVVMVGYAVISVPQFLHLQYIIYILISGIIIYIVVGKFSFKTPLSGSAIQEAKSKEFFTYARYALLSGLGTVAVLQIDQIMVSKFIGLEANAIYTTAIFMAVVIEMPRKFIAQISQPIVTEDLQAGRMDKIHKYYKSASINQLLVGAYIFLGIVINLPNIYALMPSGDIYSEGLSIVYIIGFAKLINMVFSINGEIIVMSDHYRINILLIALLGFMTICLNLLLIPKYGIEGAAYATLLTFFLFNLIKYFYIKIKFDFSPFSKWTIPSVLLIPLFLYLNSLMGYSDSIILDIVLRSILISIGFLSYILFLKPSIELLNIWKMMLEKIGIKKSGK